VKYGTGLTPQSIVLLGKLVVEQQVRKFPEFYGRQVLLPCSPERCIGTHPEPYESSLENPTRFNIILTSLRIANIITPWIFRSVLSCTLRDMWSRDCPSAQINILNSCPADPVDTIRKLNFSNSSSWLIQLLLISLQNLNMSPTWSTVIISPFLHTLCTNIFWSHAWRLKGYSLKRCCLLLHFSK
jgi:hypothetical protein